MKLNDLVLPSFAQMLEALSGQLDKSQQAFDQEGKAIQHLMAARLAPDMFPLSAQVQFACVQAEEARGRLLATNIETIEAPGTFGEAKGLISQTVARLRDASAQKVEVNEARAVELQPSPELNFDLDLSEYIRSWSLPQFYFHLITAYAIMRKEGVDLGKADYVPHMFKFLRADAT